MLLSIKQYETIKKWIYRNARPIDLARWQYLFEEGSRDRVIRTLEAYQNEDGGFGNALEADCWNTNSSPLQTWWATQFMKEVDLPKDHPMILQTLAYLDSGDGFGNGVWLNTVASNNQFPGAPWWQHTEEGDDYIGYNPTVALAGFILKYAVEGSSIMAKGERLTREAMDYFMSANELVEMHELACFAELYEYLVEVEKVVDSEELSAFKAKLEQQVYDTIEQDSSKWPVSYCCKPSHFIADTSSIFYEAHKDIVRDEMTMLLEHMNAEGVWDVTWQWGAYEKEFAISSRWWQANVAIMNMKLLRCFDQ